MSGGAYDYISTWAGDGEMLMEKRFSLTELIDDLKRHFPDAEATKDSEKIFRLLYHFEAELSRLSGPLRNVWHEMEWWQSGDTGKEAAQKSIIEYEWEKLAARSADA